MGGALGEGGTGPGASTRARGASTSTRVGREHEGGARARGAGREHEGRALVAPAQCALLREAEATRGRKDGRLPVCGRGNCRDGDGKGGGREPRAWAGVRRRRRVRALGSRLDVGGSPLLRKLTAPAPCRTLRGDPGPACSGRRHLARGAGRERGSRAAASALGFLRRGPKHPRGALDPAPRRPSSGCAPNPRRPCAPSQPHAPATHRTPGLAAPQVRRAQTSSSAHSTLAPPHPQLRSTAPSLPHAGGVPRVMSLALFTHGCGPPP